VLDTARRMGMLVIHTRRATVPISPIARRPRSSAAAVPSASVTLDRWDAFSCAASAVTTSSPSSIQWPGKW
jgi:hypothetical protein